MKILALSAAFAAALLIAPSSPAAPKFSYPETRKVEQKDTYAGSVVVADPYRWLEDDVRTSPEVDAWVKAQNEITFGYLKNLPHRGTIRKRLAEVWNYEKYTLPVKEGGRYFFRKNDGLQNQSVLYTTRSLDETPHVLIDPNQWSKDGTVAISGFVPSPDGNYLAWGQAEAGSDWVTWRVMEVESGNVLDDEIRWIKFSNPVWTKDSKGVFYARFPAPESKAAFQGLNTHKKLYYHSLGTPQSADTLVHFDSDHPDWSYHPSVTDDGRYLVITVTVGTDSRYRVLYRDLTQSYSSAVELIDNFDHEYSFVGNDGGIFYFKTDQAAPRGRLIAIDIRHPERAQWKEILPQRPELLDTVTYVGGHFIADYLKDAHTQIEIYARDGRKVRDLDLGTLASAYGMSGRQDDTETFYGVESFTLPPSIYRYDLATGEQKLVFRSNVKGLDPGKFEVKQVFYKSKDGTRVPMFIAHKKGLKLDSNNPTLLYGYGGFNVSQTPGFKAPRQVWMEMGGVYAVANLRGGGEYGVEWHKAGTKLHKQNVFDDFIGAAEWLISNRYTRPAKLAIQGGSNGGLLVGAAMTQRPELFGAALPAVGVMDMLRFQRFTAGRYWTDDYGSSDNADEFKALYAYSPYHNLRKGTRYPATLVTTADTDDRVVPGHSFKFAAALQEAHAGDAPVLIRIETRAGHGAGKPTSKQVDEAADLWAFLVANLGMKMK